MFSSVTPTRQFTVSSCIPLFEKPSTLLTLTPTSYEKVANVIRSMKTSGSPCPLDQISVICFKRCPYHQTVITEIIAVVWKAGRVPSAWKRACTILVHKKGNHDDPANFRPITLQSVPLKIFTSCLRETIFSFLKQNGFVEQRIQKGFTHGISGVLEHTSMMGHVINKVCLKQRSVVITLLDLRMLLERFTTS